MNEWEATPSDWFALAFLVVIVLLAFLGHAP
jgi:hypothetical protein